MHTGAVGDNLRRQRSRDFGHCVRVVADCRTLSFVTGVRHVVEVMVSLLRTPQFAKPF
jgi:hypothetical protein